MDQQLQMNQVEFLQAFKIGLEFGKHFQIQAGPRFLADDSWKYGSRFRFWT